MYPAVLVAMVAVPLAGALVLSVSRDDGRWGRWLALGAALFSLACAVVLAKSFVESAAGTVVSWSWLPEVGIRCEFGIDGISLWLVVLSSLLSVSAVLVSWDAIRERVRGFYSLLLLLQAGMLGVFLSRDVILFYVFFEFTLVPLFFLIGVWGSPAQRQLAARKFFIYTFAGSVLTFLGLIYIVIAFADGGALVFSIPELASSAARGASGEAARIPPVTQWWLFAALLIGFSVKVPLVPVHTWLPLAHAEAPTAGSVLLAGVLLKIGVYGFLRFNLALLPDASYEFLVPIMVLSVIGIIYGGLVALAQNDIKRLVAYSSVSHMGFCMLGVFSANAIGVSGGLLQCVNHGLATGGLFAMVGMLYERYHTREISSFGGLARKMPVLTFFFIVITMASIGLPGLNGFVGEFLVLAAVFQNGFYILGACAATGIILSAIYMLWLVQRVFFGPLREPAHDGEPVSDLCLREVLTLAPIASACLFIGLFPNLLLEPMAGDIQAITGPLQRRAKVSAGEQRSGAVPLSVNAIPVNSKENLSP